MEFKADLHCHSTRSDGSFSPKELVDLAAESELQGLSITDHDTVIAYREVEEYAKEKGITLLPGVEFSAVFDQESVHILSYAFDPNNQGLLTFCKWHKKRREKRVQKILENLKKAGVDIDLNSVWTPSSLGSIGRPHIAHSMVRQGVVSSVSDAFKRFLGRGKVGYYQGEVPSVADTLRVIHEAGGLAIIAHPHLIKKTSLWKQLAQFDFDGLEGYYALFPLDEEQKWIKRGKKKGWVVTGGSDFHGEAKPRLTLGCSWTDQKTFDQLMSHFRG